MDSLNGLAEKWGNLQLNEEEQESIIVGEDSPKEEVIKERCSMVGKIFLKRNIS